MSNKVTPNDSGSSISPWMQVGVPDYWAELPSEVRVDACVVGAGMCGLSTAYHLSRAGQEVLVIDDGPMAGGETGRTTAHLSTALDDRYYWLEKIHGAEGARLAAASHAEAIDDIEAIIERERIDCDFRRVDGYLFAPPGATTDPLMRELAACQRAGLADVELIPRAPLPGFDTGPCLRFGNQAQFHPVKYLRGLAKAIVERGGRICSGVRAERIERGRPARIITEGNRLIRASSAVIATNAPINSRVAIPMKQSAHRSYVVALLVPHGTVPVALYWDTAEPYHYARIIPGVADADNDIVIVGGEDHRTGRGDDTAAGRWQRLVDWTRDHFVGATHVVARWSGQIMEPSDGLAFIGHSPGEGDNVYVATGDSGNGITHGAIAGVLLTDLILGNRNVWADLYDPRRSSLRAPREFLREAASSTAAYADWLSGGDVDSIEDIPRGGGAVVRRGLHMIAVYRDDTGVCHERSAACTHLGGVVSWNGAERTWDCPCHGSRFDAHGRVVNGPAVADLHMPGGGDVTTEIAADADTQPIDVPASPTTPSLVPLR